MMDEISEDKAKATTTSCEGEGPVEKVENNFESQRTIDTSRAETIGEEEGDQQNPPFLIQNKLHFLSINLLLTFPWYKWQRFWPFCISFLLLGLSQ